VGLLVPDIRYTYTATLARGVEDVLAQAGYIALIASTEGDPQKELLLLEQLRKRGVDGFILTPAQFGISAEVEEMVKALINNGVPVVVAGDRIRDPQVEYVTFQSQTATKEAIDYLVGLGHREIGFIGGRHSQGVAISRWLGYQESLLTHQIALRPELVIETDMTPADGAHALATLLALPNPPTAVLALNDLLAMGVLDLCYERGLRLPEQLSVVGFDYQPMAQRTTPAVTSVVIPVYEIGQKTAEVFLQRIHQPTSPPQQLTLGHHLAIRQTTAPLV
jgi:DNA-binding LacI/PurR family transcriptional regulator